MQPAPAILACLLLTGVCGDHAGDTPMRTSASNAQQELRSRRTDQQIVVEGNTAFALDLYAKLRQRRGNLFVSPSSISLAPESFIAVDERGTEAAAATAVVMALSAAGRSPVFRADHPFLFLIRHQATGSILFMGRLARP